MGVIRQLPDEVINRIAAGEVVERPASVLKELLENALDTTSNLIEVEIDGGGTKCVTVRDHGEGMDRNDLLMALERHATSKLSADADLVAIPTLGFRGEALPSIAAVTDLRLRSRLRGAPSGFEAQVVAGVIRDVVEVGMPEGTEVRAARLFHKLPARRKFLRSPDTEKGHCLNIFSELALSAPQRMFRLLADGREIYNLPPTTDLAVRAKPFFPGIDHRDWLRLEYTADDIRVTGLIAPPTFHQGGWSGLHLFVNGRAVQDKTARYAVREAYRLQLPAGRFPRGVVMIYLPPDRVDVNVHPQKFEVRFREPQALRMVVQRAVDAALKDGSCQPVPPFAGAAPAVRPDLVLQSPAVQGRLPLGGPGGGVARAPQPCGTQGSAPPAAAAEAGVPSRSAAVPGMVPLPAGLPACRADYRLVGSVRHSYLIVERDEAFYLVDQHAAHERKLFEQFMGDEGVASMGLLVPYTLELNRAEALLAKPWLAELKKFGFGLEPFGGSALLINAVPAALGHRAGDRRLLVQVVEDLLRDREGLGRVSDLRDRLAKTIACKAAIKAGEPLQPEEMLALCDFVFGEPPRWTCPHGRPICWKITWDELARKLART